MQGKQIIGAVLMVILTVAGILISITTAIIQVLNSDEILSSMVKSNYIDKSTQEAKTVLTHYMSYEKVEEILENVNVRSHIKDITEAFDSNIIEEIALKKKNEMKQQILSSLDENISKDTKENFANIVSDAYIKTIFPVKELNILSEIYEAYSTKLILFIFIMAVVVIAIYLYLAYGHKTYKWAIIALYNIIIINIVLVFALGVFNGVVIGNDRTTALIITMLNKIKTNVIIGTSVIFIIAVISNYIAYFRKRRHSKKGEF